MKRRLSIALQMDALSALNFMTDSSLRLASSAQERGHRVYFYEPQELSWQPGLLSAPARELLELRLPTAHYLAKTQERLDLGRMDAILLRQNPPFDMAYITSTHLLELVSGKVLVLNDPKGVRNSPEKILGLQFAEFTPPTLISRDVGEILRFKETHADLVLKPLFGYAGHGVFHFGSHDENFAAALELLLAQGPEPLIIQRYLPQIRDGDRRIILIDGDPVGVFARLPAAGEARANLRAGGTALATSLTDREREICAALGPTLRERGLFLVGIDVIGGWLTEINVTSPTGLAQLDSLYGIQPEKIFWEKVEQRLGI